MTGEWVERRVADLEVGDDVRDYGVLRSVETHLQAGIYVIFNDGVLRMPWPAHARVDIRRPAEVTVSNGRFERGYISIDGKYVGSLCKAHAEEYAARLRSSAHDRALALGKDTA